MFQCAWCKNDTNVCEWSKEKEPLCLECFPKYNFGFRRGMIIGKVSDLSKEQKREVSEKLHNLKRFWGALRSINREVLVGRAKILSAGIGWLFFIILILAMVVLQEVGLPDWFIFRGFLGDIVGFVAVPAYFLFAYSLHKKIVWYLKFRQLKNEL